MRSASGCVSNAACFIERIIRRKYVTSGRPEQGVKSPPAVGNRGRLSLRLQRDRGHGGPQVRLSSADIPIGRLVHSCGWFPSRSTINDMLDHCVNTVQPLVDQMWQQLLAQAILLADQTRVLLLTRVTQPRQQGQRIDAERRRSRPTMTRRPSRRIGFGDQLRVFFAGLDGLAPYNYFHWSLTRSHSVVDQRLSQFSGTVVADAYEAYGNRERSGGRIVHASCNWHARREFVKAEAYEPILCAQLISLYQQLYAIEERAKTWSAERVMNCGSAKQPISQQIEQWLQRDQSKAALPSSRFGKAVGYLQINGRRYSNTLRTVACHRQRPGGADHSPVGCRSSQLVVPRHPRAALGRLQLLSLVSSASSQPGRGRLSDRRTQETRRRQSEPSFDLELDSDYLLELCPTAGRPLTRSRSAKVVFRKKRTSP